MNSKERTHPAYQSIAVDMASRIYQREFPLNTKLRGRTSLASEYNVSSETIRKAMRLLEDMGIVKVVQGSGIYIESYSKAEEFMKRFKVRENLFDMKKKMYELLNRKKAIEEETNKLLADIIDYSERFKHSALIMTLEIDVPENSHVVGKSIGDTKVWQNTGATIIGIKRNEEIIISPGPYETFRTKDRILFIGNNESVILMKEFLEKSIL